MMRPLDSALVATRHALDARSDAKRWSLAVEAWEIATESILATDPDRHRQAIRTACKAARDACENAEWCSIHDDDVDLVNRCAMIAAEVVMMWIE